MLAHPNRITKLVMMETLHERRAVLVRLSFLIGATALPTSWAAGSLARAAEPQAPERIACLTAIADHLIPRTDTPGAIDADVPRSVMALLDDWASPAHRERYLAQIETISRVTLPSHGQRFENIAPDQQKLALAKFDHAASEDMDYRKFKELLLITFYSSEVGATQELRYELVPGIWEPSIPVDATTRTWAA